jgi:hypothetical protein
VDHVSGRDLPWECGVQTLVYNAPIEMVIGQEEWGVAPSGDAGGVVRIFSKRCVRFQYLQQVTRTEAVMEGKPPIISHEFRWSDNKAGHEYC